MDEGHRNDTIGLNEACHRNDVIGQHIFGKSRYKIITYHREFSSLDSINQPKSDSNILVLLIRIMSATSKPAILPEEKEETSSPRSTHHNPGDSNLLRNANHPRISTDPERADTQRLEEKVSVYKSLGWLDRFLAVWILLAMIIGVLLGNFVPNVGSALDKGKFVRVSVPIGIRHCLLCHRIHLLTAPQPLACS